MILVRKNKARIEGNAVVLINQIELILSAYKDGLLEVGETTESAKEIILLAVENAFKYKDYYRYSTVDEQEETLENELMILLKQRALDEVSEKRTYDEIIGNVKIEEHIRRIKR